MSTIQTAPPFCATAFAFHAPQKPLLVRFSSMRTHLHPNLLSSTSPSKPTLTLTSTSTTRRLLCKPPSAKYLRQDYLVRKVSSEELQELVKSERSVPLVVDFYATWCGPCILMAQELESLAVEYESNAIIVKVDTDEEYEFARDMQVRGLPTLLFISPNSSKDAIRTEGLIPKQMMRDIIDNEM